MRFNSLLFLGFLAIVVAVAWLLPPRHRRYWLLAASYVFYGAWNFLYLPLLFGCAAVNHWGAKWIVSAQRRSRRGFWVLAANVLLLAVFKYLDWLIGNANVLARWLGWNLDLPMLDLVEPLGISFYVFEAISYTVDIIRKRERIHSFWDFQLFIAFFPKLIAGPIMRAKELLPQIESGGGRLTSFAAREGLWLLGSGLFIKIVLADGLAPAVENAFSLKVAKLGATDVYVAAVAFGLQIYFDFSSYSRIALGAARLCGIQLVENFNFPYIAHSPVEFWNRWHMSLSRWVRDYLFFPLLGKQSSLAAMCRAALLAMTMCGVWHGARWTYVLWGLYHGVLIAGYHVLTYRGRTAGAPPRGDRPLVRLPAILVTFGLVSFGWILFRSSSVAQAFGLWQRALTPWSHANRALPGTFYLHTAALTLAVWAAPSAVRLWNKLTAAADESRPMWLDLTSSVTQGVALGGFAVLSLIYLQGQKLFIYFQF